MSTEIKGPEISELFEDYFISFYLNDTIDPNYLTTSLSDMVDLHNIQFSLSKNVLNLCGLSSNPSPSPDGVPEIVLKSWGCTLSVTIGVLIKWSLTNEFIHLYGN